MVKIAFALLISEYYHLAAFKPEQIPEFFQRGHGGWINETPTVPGHVIGVMEQAVLI
jgi:hypothetical protein